jgi:plastocyanin
MNKKLVVGSIAIGVALTMSVACSAAKDLDPTPVKQFKITPASGSRTPAPSATATAPATAAASPVPGTPVSQGTAGAGGGSTVNIAASNLLFDKSKLTASAGTVKIELDNKDGGIPHNIDVFEGKDATGKSLGKTDIVAGPTKQMLTLDLKPGTYYFQCDVHLATMSGTLTVN